MPKKVHITLSSLDPRRMIDADYESDCEILSLKDKTIYEFIDNDKIKNVITIGDRYINIKREGDNPSSLDLMLDQNTMYNLSTPFGNLSLGINTIDILINHDYIYAKYYIEPDSNIYHEFTMKVF